MFLSEKGKEDIGFGEVLGADDDGFGLVCGHISLLY